MLENTFTTFHASNVLLQQQYREHKFTEYSESISCLLVAEKNNELLMRNHQSHPIRFEPFFEVNVISSQTHGRVNEDVVVEGIFDTMELMVVIIQIPKKGKPHGTTRSEIIPRSNKKLRSIYKIHLVRPMKIIAIDVV